MGNKGTENRTLEIIITANGFSLLAIFLSAKVKKKVKSLCIYVNIVSAFLFSCVIDYQDVNVSSKLTAKIMDFCFWVIFVVSLL